MQLEEILQALNGLPADQRAQLEREALHATRHMRWVPNPGPQTEAYHSEADELYYGGSAGGGKSDLVLGLALNEHQHTSVFREFKDDARALGARLCEIVGSSDGWNDSQAIWRCDKQRVHFYGLPNEKDKEHHKGKPRDLYAFDEIPDFTESSYLFVTSWNRSTDQEQRCRIVCTGNPPTRAKGLWVIKRWAAWLDKTHPNPAEPGELRWYLRGEDDQEVEVEGPGPYVVDGKETRARSRTFIRAKLEDNPDLARTDYDSTLAQLPAELRAAYREGRFDVGLKDHPYQVVPTAWVLEAQKRWLPRPPQGVPMCAVGVDPAEGGADRYTIVTRYDWWISEAICIPGKQITGGRAGAGHVLAARRDQADIMLDMGGGYGSNTHTALTDNGIAPQVYKGSTASMKRTKDKKLGFANKRAELYWLLREALDPDQQGGSPVALPQDPELVSDLTVLTYEVDSRNRIAVLPKEKVTALLGRSPDKGDATALAWSCGPRGLVPTMGPGQYGREQYIPRKGSSPSGQHPISLGHRHRPRH